MHDLRCMVTGAAGDIGQAIATILRETDCVAATVGADMRADHPGPAFFDSCITLPSARHAAYADRLCEALDRYHIDVLIPTSEAEIGALQDPALVARLPVGLRILRANHHAVSVGLDKLATAQMLTNLGRGAPWTRRCGDGIPPELPCIIKPRQGQGSKGVAILRDSADVKTAITDRPEDIFQQLLLPEDQEYTCALFASASGTFRCLVLHRVLANGFSVSGSVVDTTPFFPLLKGIAEALNLVGAINVQCRLTTEGPKVFEINPRFSSTVEMRHRMGFQDVLWSLQDLFKKQLSSYAEPQSGTRFFRVSRSVILPALEG
jgi:carbamoyl-phosphate synthase large subunit